MVESSLGSYSSGLVAGWGSPDCFDAVGTASQMLGDPNVWTDGSLVLGHVTGVSSSVLGSSLISQGIVGVVVGGVISIMFVQRVRFSLAMASALFLGLFN